MGDITSDVTSSVEENLKEIINRYQLELIEELTVFISRLNKTLINCSSPSTKIAATFREPKTFPDVLQQQFAFKKVNFISPS